MIRKIVAPFKWALHQMRHPSGRMQSGQALVVLAIGFIGLLGFVGIVTDVSLLFVRYSTMRRAVDAASVAAAGQMRRIIDETPGDSVADDEADSIANLNLAARQFIEIYGLNPTNVLVETCRAQNVVRDPLTLDPQDRDGNNLFNADGTVNTSANEADVDRYQELCTADELKLVRVTAQIEAPTIFMSLLGYSTVTLTESAISQTAVIDVVLILDVSESMLNETTYDDWDTLSPPQGVRYLPPYVDDAYDNEQAFTDESGYVDRDTWTAILNASQTGLNRAIDLNTPGRTAADIALEYQVTDTMQRFVPVDADADGDYDSYVAFVDADSDGRDDATGRQEPRDFCRVRAYPTTSSNSYTVPGWLRTEYAGFLGGGFAEQWEQENTDIYAYLDIWDSGAGAPYPPQFPSGVPIDPDDTGANSRYFRGFVPMYNYYGCCNDPDGALDAAGNFDFSDLICQPFRQARDAAEEFLARLDFIRGDRVAYVTFDRRANVRDPIVVRSGADVQAAMFESERSFNDDAGVLLRYGALDYLRKAISVRGENTFYTDRNVDGFYDAFVEPTAGVDQAADYAELMSINIGSFVNSPVAGACPYDAAVAGGRFSLARTYSDGSPRANNLLQEVHTVPDWYTGGSPELNSYEFRGSCAGTNIGGALAAGSSTLYSQARRDGAVWIMVMLSDGAAGASNPVRRESVVTSLPDPYNKDGITGYNVPLNALGGEVPLRSYPPDARAYGAFGLCPYGTTANNGEVLRDSSPPYCSDLLPNTRTLCGTTAQNPDTMLLGSFPNCYEFYDVDDYARDWADWIGLADLPGAIGAGGGGRVANQLLPAIFTIGFGLNFNDGVGCGSTDYNCQRGNPPARPASSQMLWREDYLGEELLRYIADVGDNAQIDTDFWQLQMGGRIGNAPPADWGPRGSCEETAISGTRGTVYQPLPPKADCGNYFAADTEGELIIVFNEIASRMFTRLAQ